MKSKINDFLKKIIKYFILIINFAYAQDFQINEGEYAEFAPQISADAVGNFIVVWTDYRNSYENGGTDSGAAIYGQLFLNNGIAVNENFRISEDELDGSNRLPSVAMNSNGNFIVVWHRTNDKVWGDTDIYARIFNRDGFPQSQSFKINDDTTNKAQFDAKVILQDDNSFVITWADRRDNGLFSYAQLFDNFGIPIGKNYKVNKNNIEDIAKISQFRDGKFLFHWGEYIEVYNIDGTSYSDSIINIGINGIAFAKGKDSILVLWTLPSTYEIFGCFFNLDGLPISASFKVNDDNIHNPVGVPGAAFFNDVFIIIWQDHRNDLPGILGTGDIYAQRFNSAGENIGDNFKINHESEEFTQRDPAVIFKRDNFITVWKETHPICLPFGNFFLDRSYIMGTTQRFSYPIPGEIFGWITLKDSCEDNTSEPQTFANLS